MREDGGMIQTKKYPSETTRKKKAYIPVRQLFPTPPTTFYQQRKVQIPVVEYRCIPAPKTTIWYSRLQRKTAISINCREVAWEQVELDQLDISLSLHEKNNPINQTLTAAAFGCYYRLNTG
jgi:hypothetical protein